MYAKRKVINMSGEKEKYQCKKVNKKENDRFYLSQLKLLTKVILNTP